MTETMWDEDRNGRDVLEREVPREEPQRQYYFIERAKKILQQKERLLGRPLTACTMIFGCQMNVHDSERMSGLLEANGYVRAEEGVEPDLVVFNTCAVRENAANRLALFAPEAVVNTIDHFKVINKRRLTLPEEIAEVFRCPNTNCASHGEPVKSRFYVRKQSGQTKLKCHYCEKTFSRDSVTEA